MRVSLALFAACAGARHLAVVESDGEISSSARVEEELDSAMMATQEAMLEAEAASWKRSVDDKYKVQSMASKRLLKASFLQSSEAQDDQSSDEDLDAQMEAAMLETQEAMLEAEAARWKKDVDTKYEQAQKIAAAKKVLKAAFIQMKEENLDDAAVDAQMEEAMLQTQEAMLEAETAQWKKQVDAKYQEAQNLAVKRDLRRENAVSGQGRVTAAN
mmetsp:Transcript_14390/g.32758  ORF Transcript_14390/g.32758 Transcript_14390/m.32758 type:complete len:215 (+) Transcript_14390:124-768(+)